MSAALTSRQRGTVERKVAAHGKLLNIFVYEVMCIHPAPSRAHMDTRLQKRETVGVGYSAIAHDARQMLDMYETDRREKTNTRFYAIVVDAGVADNFVVADVRHVGGVRTPGGEKKI